MPRKKKTRRQSRLQEPLRQPIPRGTIIKSLLALGLIIFILFSPALENEFTNWDDNVYVTENKAIRELSLPNIWKIFTTPLTKTFAPLSVLSFAIEYHFFGLIPFYYILLSST